MRLVADEVKQYLTNVLSSNSQGQLLIMSVCLHPALYSCLQLLYSSFFNVFSQLVKPQLDVHET